MDAEFVLFVATVWTVLITFLWLSIGSRAMKAHERLAKEVAKIAALQGEEAARERKKELSALREDADYPRFRKNAPPEGNTDAPS